MSNPATDAYELQERAAIQSESDQRTFEALSESRFILIVPEIASSLEIDRVRRIRNELVGELAVRCQLSGAKTFDGSLHVADFNLSSARAREDRAKTLCKLSRIPIDRWTGILEEFVQRVLAAERRGDPAVDLRTLPRPVRDDIEVEGFRFPRRHPSIIFGDGGSAKSFTALYLAGRLAAQGMRIGLFDWELAGEDHRERLESLFGADMPRLMYARCDRPLVAEVDRLSRIVQDNRLEYLIYDSVAYATDGPPEAAEAAGRYFRAVRQIATGSLHIAHITKSGEGNDRTPFGSIFWHNSARATWYVRAAEQIDGATLTLACYHRKANLGPIRPTIGFTITFGETETTYRRSDPGDTPDLAAKMSTAQRMAYLLRRGSMSVDELAEELDAKPETVKRTARRGKTLFTTLKDGKLALLERNRADKSGQPTEK